MSHPESSRSTPTQWSSTKWALTLRRSAWASFLLVAVANGQSCSLMRELPGMQTFRFCSSSPTQCIVVAEHHNTQWTCDYFCRASSNGRMSCTNGWHDNNGCGGGGAYGCFFGNDDTICQCVAAPTTAPPTRPPTLVPTHVPTESPTLPPTLTPTSTAPTTAPTSLSPTHAPSTHPTAVPSVAPTLMPTSAAPSADPTSLPPSHVPTSRPTIDPTALPSRAPISAAPVAAPTAVPSAGPTSRPTPLPTHFVSIAPSAPVSMAPSVVFGGNTTASPASGVTLPPAAASRCTCAPTDTGVPITTAPSATPIIIVAPPTTGSSAASVCPESSSDSLLWLVILLAILAAVLACIAVYWWRQAKRLMAAGAAAKPGRETAAVANPTYVPLGAASTVSNATYAALDGPTDTNAAATGDVVYATFDVGDGGGGGSAPSASEYGNPATLSSASQYDSPTADNPLGGSAGGAGGALENDTYEGFAAPDGEYLHVGGAGGSGTA
eukprot:m.134612 g.134612  ORF g.134612 m.134612 type:complete len:494 (+) comp13877_c0_seq2:115-1596(+)